MATTTEIIIIGAGMAGASAAAELSASHKVILAERESAPGYHSTGRSAALFSEIYGNEPVRALTRASRDFFFATPSGFSEHALTRPRDVLYIGRAGQTGELHDFLADEDVAAAVRLIDTDTALSLCPVVKPDAAAFAVLESDAADVDVDALHQGYLRKFRHNGGQLVTDCGIDAIARIAGSWRVRAGKAEYSAPILVNAAGAWADVVAQMAGVSLKSIQPRRRTALLIELAAGLDAANWPMVIAIDESFYFKPDAGLLFVSPADETPIAPCDVQPEEFDVAVAIDRLETATTLSIRRVRRKWAGLRSFAPDRTPVIGFDNEAPGFFWLAGQGGYGIQTAPAISALAASLIRGARLPNELSGFDPRSVSPNRF